MGGDYEKPVHRVSVGKFAMEMYEVTFAEYDKFADATGKNYRLPTEAEWDTIRSQRKLSQRS